MAPVLVLCGGIIAFHIHYDLHLGVAESYKHDMGPVYLVHGLAVTAAFLGLVAYIVQLASRSALVLLFESVGRSAIWILAVHFLLFPPLVLLQTMDQPNPVLSAVAALIAAAAAIALGLWARSGFAAHRSRMADDGS